MFAMTQPPKDYIASRRMELNKQKQAIDAELAVLDRMESAILGAPLVPGIAAPAEGDGPKRRQFEKSIKEMVLTVLERPVALLAIDILAFIKEQFGVVIERTSLSPQLSRLKVDGLVTVQDGHWQITQEGLNYLAQTRFGQKNIFE